VLISALQLLVRVLAHPSRVGQKNALSFLGAHRDSLLILLRENQAYITATGIDESRLVVALFTSVVPKVSPDEVRSSSGFGAFHHAVLSLAAKFLEPTWVDSLRGDASPAEAKDKVLHLNQVIIAYLVATTAGLKAGSPSSPRPVFVVDAARSNGAARIGSAPSLSSAVEYVAELAEAVQDVSNAYDDVADKLEAGEDVGVAGFGAESVEELQASFVARTSAIFSESSARRASSHLPTPR
jgi:nuclear pore complex protein Nup205